VFSTAKTVSVTTLPRGEHNITLLVTDGVGTVARAATTITVAMDLTSHPAPLLCPLEPVSLVYLANFTSCIDTGLPHIYLEGRKDRQHAPYPRSQATCWCCSGVGRVANKLYPCACLGGVLCMVAEGWSGTQASRCSGLDAPGVPGGVLGGFSYFSGGTMALELSSIPEHTGLRLEFDFYAIDVWNPGTCELPKSRCSPVHLAKRSLAWPKDTHHGRRPQSPHTLDGCVIRAPHWAPRFHF
jgi:hypothetical protein